MGGRGKPTNHFGNSWVIDKIEMIDVAQRNMKIAIPNTFWPPIACAPLPNNGVPNLDLWFNYVSTAESSEFMSNEPEWLSRNERTKDSPAENTHSIDLAWASNWTVDDYLCAPINNYGSFHIRAFHLPEPNHLFNDINQREMGRDSHLTYTPDVLMCVGKFVFHFNLSVMMVKMKIQFGWKLCMKMLDFVVSLLQANEPSLAFFDILVIRRSSWPVAVSKYSTILILCSEYCIEFLKIATSILIESEHTRTHMHTRNFVFRYYSWDRFANALDLVNQREL